MSTVPYRPLGHISAVMEKMNLEVTFAYENIVYVSHSAFILVMGEIGEEVFLYFNIESNEEDRQEILRQLTEAATGSELSFIDSGFFEMNQKGQEEIELKFYE